MHLRKIEGFGPDQDDFAPVSGVPASERPSRPGMALDALVVPLDAKTTARVEGSAARCGVTIQLWAQVAIEARRALAEISDALGADPETTVGALDCAAVHASAPELARRSELVTYARGLRGATPRRARDVRGGALPLSVPTHMLLAWRTAATTTHETVEAWAARCLSASHRAPLAWEAASADSGLSLGEWVAVQAARAATLRSSAAQIWP
jgi:hypothetical protein